MLVLTLHESSWQRILHLRMNNNIECAGLRKTNVNSDGNTVRSLLGEVTPGVEYGVLEWSWTLVGLAKLWVQPTHRHVTGRRRSDVASHGRVS